MKPLNCAIVDDDEIDRLTAVAQIRKYPELHLTDIFSSSIQALEKLNPQTIDLLFLDIDMPEISGLELRKKLTQIPACIFITSHAEHAVESFELDALDFIVKPIKSDRFAHSVSRITTYFEMREKAELFENTIGGDTIYIKDGHEQIKIKLHEILYLEALKDYTLLVTEQKRHCVLSSLGNLLKDDRFNSFVRTHKSYAVQKQYINKISANELILKDKRSVPLGRAYKEGIREIL